MKEGTAYALRRRRKGEEMSDSRAGIPVQTDWREKLDAGRLVIIDGGTGSPVNPLAVF